MVTGIRITKWQTRDPERLAWQLSEFERRLLKISSSGSTEECCDVTDFLIQIPGIAARGDILFYGAAGWELLHAGTSGHVLHTSGAGADPVWAAGGGGGGVSDGVYGDITVSGGGTVWSITPAVIAPADFANAAPLTLFGNPVGAGGTPQFFGIGSSLSFVAGPNLVRAALTGDVTAASDSNATTIANSAVTLAKMANLAANSILGNNTGGAAAPSALTVAQVKTLLAYTTGDIGAQPLDADLTAIAALSGTNNIYYRSAANTWSSVTIGSGLTFSAGTLAASGGGGGFTNTVVSQAPAANQQDWTITGRTSYTTVLTTNTTNSFLGGVTGGASGDVLHVVNGSADTMLWLVHEDPGSTAANRFNLHRSSAFLPPGETATFVYNATASRWALLSMSIDMMAITEKTQLFAPNTGTTVTTIGIGASSSTATISTGAPTATPANDFTENAYTQVTNSAASGSSDVRATVTKFMRGATTGRQGIFFNACVRFTALGATGGVAVGLTSSTAVINTQPSANTNVIYIGANGGQTTLRAICRDGAAGTPVDLGANFPVPNATAAYEVCFFCPSNVAKVNYMVRRLDTDFKTEGTFTTNLPSDTLLMGHRINVMVGATATASTAQFTRMLTRHVS